MPDIDLRLYYTAAEAAGRLSTNSGKPVSQAYVRRLAGQGKVESLKINSRFSYYLKSQIDSYVVGSPGRKARKSVPRAKPF